jgi:hypothetical protein
MLSVVAMGAADSPTYTTQKAGAFMKNWLVLKPIPVSASTNNTAHDSAEKAAFARDWLEATGGEDKSAPRAGLKQKIGDREFEWRLLNSKNETVDLKSSSDPGDNAIAYAWAEVEAPSATNALLGVGSDDAVKVWLNGRLVHENWIGRPCEADDDVIPVQFEKGKNRLLLKIQNQRVIGASLAGSWTTRPKAKTRRSSVERNGGRHPQKVARARHGCQRSGSDRFDCVANRPVAW